MREFIKRIKAVTLFEVLLSLCAGILFIACPDFTKTTIIYIFGALFVAIGIIKVVNYFMYGIEPFGLLLGVANATLGTIILSSAQYLSTSGVFGFIFGLIFIVKSLFQMQWAITCGKFGIKNWWYDLIISILILVMGILLVYFRATEDIFMYFLGVILILNALYDLIDTLFVSIKIKKAKKSFKDLLEKTENVIVIDDENNEN